MTPTTENVQVWSSSQQRVARKLNENLRRKSSENWNTQRSIEWNVHARCLRWLRQDFRWETEVPIRIESSAKDEKKCCDASQGFQKQHQSTKIRFVQEIFTVHRHKSETVLVNYTQSFPPVKSQGICLSCWAFASVAVIEYFMWKSGKRWMYSEQNLVDCSELNFGCTGGWPTLAFKYIRDKGISNGTRYKYKGVKQDCQRTDRLYPPVLKIPNVCEVLVNGDEKLLQKLLVQYGPVAGAVCK